MRREIALIVTLFMLGSCSPAEETSDPTTLPPTTMTSTTLTDTTTTTLPDLALTSPAFASGEPIPGDYTCDGEDISPQLDLVGLPAGTNALAVIVEDPDAPLGTWYHWVEFDIRAGPGQYTFERDTPPVGTQGSNSWSLEGYMGPCPPPGETHSYVFRVYALSQTVGLPAGVPATEVVTAMEGHVLTTIELSGSYGR